MSRIELSWNPGLQTIFHGLYIYTHTEILEILSHYFKLRFKASEAVCRIQKMEGNENAIWRVVTSPLKLSSRMYDRLLSKF